MPDYGEQNNNLDSNQVIKESFDKAKIAHRVISLNPLVTEDYDEIDIAYIVAGAGIGEMGLITYKKNTTIVAVLQLDYDIQNRLTNVKRI